MRKVRPIRKPLAFFASLLAAMAVAAFTLLHYGIPLLDNERVSCSFGGAHSFGCSSHFGIFGIVWLSALVFTIRGIWKRFGEPLP